MKKALSNPLVRIAIAFVLIKLAMLFVYGPEGPKSSLQANPHAFDSVAEDCTTIDPDTGETGETGEIDLDCAKRAIYY